MVKTTNAVIVDGLPSVNTKGCQVLTDYCPQWTAGRFVSKSQPFVMHVIVAHVALDLSIAIMVKKKNAVIADGMASVKRKVCQFVASCAEKACGGE